MSNLPAYTQFSNGSYEPSLGHGIEGSISDRFGEYTILTTEASREIKKHVYEIPKIFDEDKKVQLTEKLIFSKPKIATEEWIYSNILTEFQSAIFPFHPALPYRILDDARIFVLAQKKSSKIFQSINKIVEQANEFLNKKGLKTDVTVDLFTDQEYVDWKEPRIYIKVIDADLSKISELRTEIYNAAFEKVSPKTAKNIVLHIGISQRGNDS